MQCKMNNLFFFICFQCLSQELELIRLFFTIVGLGVDAFAEGWSELKTF